MLIRCPQWLAERPILAAFAFRYFGGVFFIGDVIVDGQQLVGALCMALGLALGGGGIALNSGDTVDCSGKVMTTTTGMCVQTINGKVGIYSYEQRKQQLQQERSRARWIYGGAGILFIGIGVGSFIAASRRTREEEQAAAKTQSWIGA